MFCSECGSKISEEASFCSECGAKVNKPQAKSEEKTNLVVKAENTKQESSYQIASQGKRLVNFLIDYILVLRFIIPVLVYILFPYEDESTLFVIQVAFIILYFFLTEVTTGKTLGKVITRTKVVSLSNEKPSASSILIRTLCRFIPFDAFSYLSTKPIGWHDSLSKTYVVEKIPSLK